MTNTYFQRTINKEKAEDEKGNSLIPYIINSNKYDEYYHKFDGTHLDLYIYQDEPIKLITREGNDVSHLVPYLIKRLERDFTYEGVFACEAVHLSVVDSDPKDSWSASRRVLGCKEYNKDEPEIDLIIYDVYEHDRQDVTNKSYIERKVFHMPKSNGTRIYIPFATDCQGIKGVYVPISYSIESLELNWEYHILYDDKEGFVLVNTQEHVDFKRTFTKLKPLLDIDVVVTGFNEGKKGTRLEGKLGSFDVSLYKKGVLTFIGKVPTMSDTERVKWTNRMLDDTLSREKYVIQVKASEVTSGFKLRFPSYVRERTDKKPEECTWEQIV